MPCALGPGATEGGSGLGMLFWMASCTHLSLSVKRQSFLYKEDNQGFKRTQDSLMSEKESP